MNRELKFRAYIHDQKIMSYFELGNFQYPDRYLNQYSYPVQQYTNIDASDGKEIYEGDIISCFEFAGNGMKDIHRTECIVIFNKGSWCYSVDGINPHQLLGYAMKVKILGNIFENPELVKSNGK